MVADRHHRPLGGQVLIAKAGPRHNGLAPFCPVRIGAMIQSRRNIHYSHSWCMSTSACLSLCAHTAHRVGTTECCSAELGTACQTSAEWDQYQGRAAYVRARLPPEARAASKNPRFMHDSEAKALGPMHCGDSTCAACRGMLLSTPQCPSDSSLDDEWILLVNLKRADGFLLLW